MRAGRRKHGHVRALLRSRCLVGISLLAMLAGLSRLDPAGEGWTGAVSRLLIASADARKVAASKVTTHRFVVQPADVFKVPALGPSRQRPIARRFGSAHKAPGRTSPWHTVTVRPLAERSRSVRDAPKPGARELVAAAETLMRHATAELKKDRPVWDAVAKRGAAFHRILEKLSGHSRRRRLDTTAQDAPSGKRLDGVASALQGRRHEV